MESLQVFWGVGDSVFLVREKSTIPQKVEKQILSFQAQSGLD